MLDFSAPLHKLGERYQRNWDRMKIEMKRRVTGFDPVTLLAYRSHAGNGRIHLVGRFVEKKGVEKPQGEASVLTNLRNTVRRFESDPVPRARLAARYGEASTEGSTDHEGFYDLTIETSEELEPDWIEVEIEVLESMAGEAGLTATAEVVVPWPDAEFGIISDVDDTILETRATDLLTELRLIFSKSARQRSPMPGATPLYQMLEGGPDLRGRNPFFYVSNSGWGLYGLIDAFIQEHDLPKGPIYLQDIAIVEPKSPKVGHEDHKRATIGRLFEDYPDMQFVLIGDSGQEDPELYRDLVKEHGRKRVRAVLIRAVTPPQRDSEVREIIQEIADSGVPAAAAESSVSLARAAADFDLIPHDAIADVREAMVTEERKA